MINGYEKIKFFEWFVWIIFFVKIEEEGGDLMIFVVYVDCR